MNDLIEKLSDLRSQFNCFDENKRDAYHTLSEAIKVISDRPEPCDDPRADVYYLAEKIGIHRLYALVVELRGEPEPCDDAVSRKEVLNLFAHNCDHVRPYIDTWEAVKRLTPVTPKRKKGKWMNLQLIPDDITGHIYGECSICLKLRKVDNFCPNCGSKMEKTERGE